VHLCRNRSTSPVRCNQSPQFCREAAFPCSQQTSASFIAKPHLIDRPAKPWQRSPSPTIHPELREQTISKLNEHFWFFNIDENLSPIQCDARKASADHECEQAPRLPGRRRECFRLWRLCSSGAQKRGEQRDYGEQDTNKRMKIRRPPLISIERPLFSTKGVGGVDRGSAARGNEAGYERRGAKQEHPRQPPRKGAYVWQGPQRWSKRRQLRFRSL
jgi:hypothetical protein